MCNIEVYVLFEGSVYGNAAAVEAAMWWVSLKLVHTISA